MLFRPDDHYELEEEYKWGMLFGMWFGFRRKEAIDLTLFNFKRTMSGIFYIELKRV